MYGTEMYGAGRVFLQFLAKFENVVINRAGGRIVLITPDFVEQFVSANDAIGILHQELEGLELLRGQNYDLTVALDFHFLEIGGNAIEADQLNIGRPRSMAESSANASE